MYRVIYKDATLDWEGGRQGWRRAAWMAVVVELNLEMKAKDEGEKEGWLAMYPRLKESQIHVRKQIQ